MALPSMDKTWQFDVNNLVTTQSTSKLTNASVLLEIKNALISFSSFPWTVVGSSNSSAAGHDAVDRWSTASNLVWNNNGSAHSWIILKQTGIDTNFQLLISCNNSSTNGDVAYISVSFSAGYTGGTTTARPTATDEIILRNNSAYGGFNTSSIAAFRVHIAQSDDGECTRIWMFGAATTDINLSGFWIFDKVKSPTAGWTNPYFVSVVATNNIATDIGVISNFGTNAYFSRHSGSSMAISLTWEGSAWSSAAAYSLTTLTPIKNEISNNFEIFPIGVVSTTAGMRGRHGQVYDLWWTSVHQPDGTFFPDDNTKNFVKVGPFVMPWPGSVQMFRG